MKVQKGPSLDLSRLGKAEVRIDTVHNWYPRLPRELAREGALRAVFRGELVPGSVPGTYRRKAGER